MRFRFLLFFLLASPALAEETRSVADIAQDLSLQVGDVADLMDGLVAVPSVTVAPEALPRIDAEAHCREVSAFSGGSAEVQNFCLNSEQTAYDKLKGTWSNYPERARSYCASLIPFAGSYEILVFCLEQEAQAVGAKKSFEY